MKEITRVVYAAMCLCLSLSWPQQVWGQAAPSGNGTLGTQTPSAVRAQQSASAPTAGNALTWEQLKARFEAQNPDLKADALGVEEARAAEISAYLRPNPSFAFSTDGTQLTPEHGVWQPLVGTQY